jgi:hypothetical protein
MRELKRWAGSQFDPKMVDALVLAVGVGGWEANVDATDEVVDPAMLVFRDHDDPSSDIAAALPYENYGLREQQQVS